MYQLKEEPLDKQITIDGEFVKHYNYIKVEQFLDKHHQFEVILDLEAVELPRSYTLEKSKQWLGKKLTTNFSGKAFIGIILDISMKHKDSDLSGQLVLKGLSQTVLLENGKQQRSWLAKDLRTVVAELIDATDIKNIITPSYNATIPYLCQYGESDYKYLQRLAKQYNEWFYFNGVDFVFGKPKTQNQQAITLEYGSDLKELDIKIQTFKPVSSSYTYNPLTDQLLEGSVNSDTTGLNDLGLSALRASEMLYGKSKDFSVSDPFLQDKSSLDAYLQTRSQQLSAQGNVLEAKGIKKGLQIGSVIKVNAARDKGEKEGFEVKHYGEYIITEIRHFGGLEEEYYNKFKAIPANVQSLPVNQELSFVKASSQIATVVNNEDPEGKGRVQVQFPWQKETNEKTSFIRVMTPDGGSSNLNSTNRGFVFIPEKGDQVMIGFEFDDPSRPFVMGSMFHGNNGAGGDSGNVKKSIITRSGHVVELNDTENSETITIKDKKGNSFLINTSEETITIKALKNINISAGNDINIEAGRNINITSGNDFEEVVAKNKKTTIGENFSGIVSKKTSLRSDSSFFVSNNKSTLVAKELLLNADKVRIESSKENLELVSTKQVDVQANDKIKLF